MLSLTLAVCVLDCIAVSAATLARHGASRSLT
jgi:hypothetical protein